MESVATMISTVGFPIAAFVLMFWFCKDQLTKMDETIKQNTNAINKLIVYMETKERSDIDGK